MEFVQTIWTHANLTLRTKGHYTHTHTATMTIEKNQRKRKQNRVVMIVNRRKSTAEQSTSIQEPTDPSPLGRWLQETLSEQPWSAVASFEHDLCWIECAPRPREESLLAENGSVGDGK